MAPTEPMSRVVRARSLVGREDELALCGRLSRPAPWAMRTSWSSPRLASRPYRHKIIDRQGLGGA